jgi:5-oxoprolinase (ATP-hydrolysing)
MLALLQSGEYPSAATPQQNMADLKAQIAANEKGVQELRKMVDQFGLDVVQAYMRHVQDNAEESVRRVITRLKDGAFTCRWTTARRSRWRSASMRERSAEIDFTGTSPQQTNNFNAPTAVCMAAVLYVFRTLVDDDIPLNAGCLKPLQVIIPPGSMLNPNPPASVVAGNVETSTCITNALVWRAGRDGGQPVHHEQLHLRQCTLPVLRDHFGRLGRRARWSTIAAVIGGFNGTAWCRPT